MPFLCARHATSKLRSFEDLAGIGTLGFRGEALASISHVAHMTVTTMAANQSHGLRATFRQVLPDFRSAVCSLLPLWPCSYIRTGSRGVPPGNRRNGTLVDCQPCAASQGTVVLVEDLFYNLPARQKSFVANGSEYLRMVHIVSQYAVFHTMVGFSIRRIGRRPDLQTSAGASQLELIRQVTACQTFISSCVLLLIIALLFVMQQGVWRKRTCCHGAHTRLPWQPNLAGVSTCGAGFTGCPGVCGPGMLFLTFSVLHMAHGLHTSGRGCCNACACQRRAFSMFAGRIHAAR